ncbi:MAG: hypothetical protein V3S25_11520 [Nitrospirales bacterium]
MGLSPKPNALTTSLAKSEGTDFDLFVDALGQDLTPMKPKQTWDLWQRVYTSTSDIGMEDSRGYRIIVAWRLTRAMMIEDKMLDMDERLNEMDFEDYPTPAVAAEREDFCLRVLHLGNQMKIYNGSKQNPHLGYYGMQGITRPDMVVDYWPSRPELLFFEDALVEQLKTLILRQSKGKTKTQMRELLGLQIKEAGALIKLSLDEAQMQCDDDLETKRFIAEGWLIDYIERSRECMDLNSEMKGLKELAKVQGLTRVEPENQMDIMVQAIAGVAAAAQRDERGPGVGPIKVLPE